MAAPAQVARRAPKKQIHKAVSKKRKFVKDGVFYAELNDFLANELSEQGYAGCEVRVTPQRTEIIIRATNSADVIGDNGRRIRELTALIQKRFKFPKTGLICFAEKVRNKGFSALTQAQAVKYRLLTGLTVRRAAYSCLKYIMDSEKKNGALGCEIIVSGKLRGQRAKGMKFRDGFMIHAGDPATYYIDTAVKHVHLPQGVIGIKVKIMKPFDATGRDGVTKELPDKITILDPKEEVDVVQQVRPPMMMGGGGGMGGPPPGPPDMGPIGGGGGPPQPPQGGMPPGPGPMSGGGGGGAGGMPGPGPMDGGQGGGGVPQGVQQPRPPMQQMGPSGGQGGYGMGGGVQDAGYGQQGGVPPPQQGGMPAQQAPVMDQGGAPQQYGMDTQTNQQYGAPAVQQDTYNAPMQQFDQYQGGQGQQGQGGQFQQFDNQYTQPMQQQYQPVQNYQQQGGQGQPQQFGNQGQYYDQNRQNYQYQ